MAALGCQASTAMLSKSRERPRAPFPCVVAGGRSRSALQSVSLTTVMARPEASFGFRRKRDIAMTRNRDRLIDKKIGSVIRMQRVKLRMS